MKPKNRSTQVARQCDGVIVYCAQFNFCCYKLDGTVMKAVMSRYNCIIDKNVSL